MLIHTLASGPIATNAYLLLEPPQGRAVLIDAPHDVWEQVEPLLRKSGCRLEALYLTHGHWDHIGDAARIAATGVPVFAHADDRMMIENPDLVKRFLGDAISLEAVTLTGCLEPGQSLDFAGSPAEVRHVPGHCPGNVLFYLAGEMCAFVGDALFAGSIGRTDLPGGDFSVLEKSIREEIYTLPEDTKIYPGHGPATSVGGERANNPFVRA